MKNKGTLTIIAMLLCLIVLLLINKIDNYSPGEELDYYLVRETVEEAMTDALDIEYYRLNSLLRIDKDKFAESFIRRFADKINDSSNYYIGIYDINETPPKVSIRVDSMTTLNFTGDATSLSTSLDAIIESNYKTDEITANALQDPNSDIGSSINN